MGWTIPEVFIIAPEYWLIFKEFGVLLLQEKNGIVLK